MRYIGPHVVSDLKKKMVFVGGPRQSGKTTFAQSLLQQQFRGEYLNWDRVSDRLRIQRGEWTDEQELLIFDEIHKYKKWKNLVKGFYDTEKNQHKFLVTGSARLDLYQRSGDSLVGRYHYWRLHPFSLFEVPANMKAIEAFKRLMTVGGFPEPFFDNDEREARRWREERSRLIIREDVRELSVVKDISQMELLLHLLRARVGSTLSMAALAQEIQVSPATVQKWIAIFEKMYLLFTINGYDKKVTRAVHKPLKAYFFDNAEVDGDEAVRFENLVANHLLKKLNFMEDYHGFRMKLYYVRDKNQKEVDFLVTKNERPQELIEVKWSDEAPSANLKNFAEKLNVSFATQIVAKNSKPWSKGKFGVSNPISYFYEKGIQAI